MLSMRAMDLASGKGVSGERTSLGGRMRITLRFKFAEAWTFCKNFKMEMKMKLKKMEKEKVKWRNMTILTRNMA